jgi:pyruvate kinase
MEVTLRGMVPVYVYVDIDTSRVIKVVANAEEFSYVKAVNYSGPGESLAGIEACDQHELPLAYNERGDMLDLSSPPMRAQIRTAHEIAEYEFWPPWSPGW